MSGELAKRMARIWTSASLGLVLLMPAVGIIPASAQDEPIFHMPFTCQSVWTASTRFAVDIPAHDEVPAEKHLAHRPSENAVDFNKGRDDIGEPVYAGADGGTVVSVYRDAKDDPQNQANQRYGNEVTVSYPGGVTLRFAHLDTVTVSEDAEDGSVMANTQIGTVGSTGLGLGNDGKPVQAYHLHYEQIVHGDVRLPVIEGQAWSIGESGDPTAEIADDHDDLVNHPGISNTSKNCDSITPVPEPPRAAAPVQWIEPVAGSTVGPDLRLAAWPTPILVDGQLTGPTDIARIDFLASWAGSSVPVCSATTAGDDGRWSCAADLAGMGVPAGSVDLSFDVLRDDGSTLEAPDGSQRVYLDPLALTEAESYLRQLLPDDATCEPRRQGLPPGAVAGFDCDGGGNPVIVHMELVLMPQKHANAALKALASELAIDTRVRKQGCVVQEACYSTGLGALIADALRARGVPVPPLGDSMGLGETGPGSGAGQQWAEFVWQPQGGQLVLTMQGPLCAPTGLRLDGRVVAYPSLLATVVGRDRLLNPPKDSQTWKLPGLASPWGGCAELLTPQGWIRAPVVEGPDLPPTGLFWLDAGG